MRIDNRFVFLLILGTGMLLGVGRAHGQGQDWTPAQLEVWQTVEAYGDAAQRRDLDAYLGYFHPDFVGWHNGNAAPDDVQARSKGIAWYFANTSTEEYTLEPMAVQVFGNVAVARYKIHQVLKQAGEEAEPGTSHWTDILIKEEGRWLLVGDHGGGVPPEWDEAASQQAESDRLSLRVEGVRIEVADLEKGLAFYRDRLGFGVRKVLAPDAVVLESEGLPLTLARTGDHVDTGGSGAKLTFQSYDLKATMADLKKQGVAFLVDPPDPYGYNQDGDPLGFSTWFQGPFGDTYSMVEQQVQRGEPFEGIRVYNTGFRVPDIEQARAFYSDVLGFEVRSEAYYPNLPLGHADGSFAFMLHPTHLAKRTDAEGGMNARMVLLFSTEDLDAAVEHLVENGVTLSFETPRQGPEGRYVAFADPFGNVSELHQRQGATAQ